jgi:DeoR family transcriptional regulator, glycerol-3-phosphate regulon repressor
LDRREQILEIARRDGRITVEALAVRLRVSPHTIRRDINQLCEDAKLRRLHGGAEFIGDRMNMPYGQRAVLNYHAKRMIAAAVAAEIPNKSTVFISIGSTPALVAEALSTHDNLTVITNNMNAALALSVDGTNRIIVPGGELRLPDLDFIDTEASLIFSSYRADYAVYGVGGVDLDGRLLDFHEPEVRAREQMRRNARKSILVADRSKFGRRAAAVGGWIHEADLVVVDSLPDPAYQPLLGDLRDRLIVCRAVAA